MIFINYTLQLIYVMLLNLQANSSSSYTRIFGNSNGKMVEKETTIKQFPDGITEHVTILKDGNKKSITTITENAKTGVQNCNKQLINLDECKYYIM